MTINTTRDAAFNNSHIPIVKELEEVDSTMMHHDTITGTSPSRVNYMEA